MESLRVYIDSAKRCSSGPAGGWAAWDRTTARCPLGGIPEHLQRVDAQAYVSLWCRTWARMSNQCEGGGVNVGRTDCIGLGPQLVVPESMQLGKWCGQKSLPPRNRQLRPPRSEIYKADPPVTKQRTSNSVPSGIQIEDRIGLGTLNPKIQSPIIRTGWKNGGMSVCRMFVYRPVRPVLTGRSPTQRITGLRST